MSSAGEKAERALRGPHKESVDVYGVDDDGTQHQILTTPEGKPIVRITGMDEDGVQRTILLTPQGWQITEYRPPTTLHQGTRTTTIGAPIPISVASVPIYNSVGVQADLDNTGRILIGNAAARPVELVAGDIIVIAIDDVQKVYFDVTVNNDRVNWWAT